MSSDYLVILDACVLVNAALRDTLLRLAEPPCSLYLPRWTQEIMPRRLYLRERRQLQQRLHWFLRRHALQRDSRSNRDASADCRKRVYEDQPFNQRILLRLREPAVVNFPQFTIGNFRDGRDTMMGRHTRERARRFYRGNQRTQADRPSLDRYNTALVSICHRESGRGPLPGDRSRPAPLLHAGRVDRVGGGSRSPGFRKPDSVQSGSNWPAAECVCQTRRGVRLPSLEEHS